MQSLAIRVGFMIAAIAAVWAPAAQAQDGESLFKRQCGACHAVDADHNKIGPSLYRIAGKKAAAAEDFEYSDALKGADITWTDDSLTKYVTDPKAFVPGGKMVYAGMKDPDDVKAVVDYLKTLK
jgi:cytochrome c